MSLQFHENGRLKTIPCKLSVFNQLRFADGLRLNQVYPKPQSKPLLTEFGIHHRLESCEGLPGLRILSNFKNISKIALVAISTHLESWGCHLLLGDPTSGCVDDIGCGGTTLQGPRTRSRLVVFELMGKGLWLN